jgi:hypothetical protein
MPIRPDLGIENPTERTLASNIIRSLAFLSRPTVNTQPLCDLLWFVAKRTGFLKSFTHVLERYVKQDADPKLILDCIVGV